MTGYIIGLALGHNASTCLLKDGQIVFSVEEERLSRLKGDGAPLLGLLKVLEYTDKVDYIAVTYPCNDRTVLEYTREHLYSGMARKLGLIDSANSQYFDYMNHHHLTHAACAMYNSVFDTAAIVVIDSAGSEIELSATDEYNKPIKAYEIESIYNFKDDMFSPIYKKYGSQNSQTIPAKYTHNECEIIIDFNAGIGKAYDAVTDYLGFTLLECGKTMGLSAYGKPNKNIPDFFIHNADWSSINPALVTPAFKAAARINIFKYAYIQEEPREDVAYKIQQETQEEVLKLLIKASEISGNKNVCLTGGYALNCAANYYYKEKLNELGINLYVEPNSSDAGTSIGAAYLAYHDTKGNE
ncbi:hypothetical protein [Lake Baikal phage Baikal-20-5m-C28]|nr:hypothetical protein [Lake Baikal phage Baikal-20-5m-C28]